MKPKWKHDCDKCRFLGGMFMPHGLMDWYLCGTTDRTILARYSDEGPDYWSKDARHLGDDHRIATEWGTDNKGFIGMNFLAEMMLSISNEQTDMVSDSSLTGETE